MFQCKSRLNVGAVLLQWNISFCLLNTFPPPRHTHTVHSKVSTDFVAFCSKEMVFFAFYLTDHKASRFCLPHFERALTFGINMCESACMYLERMWMDIEYISATHILGLHLLAVLVKNIAAGANNVLNILFANI